MSLKTDALALRVMALMAETKELGKAVLAALKTKGGGKKAAKASDASSADSASSPSTPRPPTSWQAWGKHVLADVAAYEAFKASYAHPANGSKQGVSFAYQQHRAYLNHESADGGLTEEYAEFIAPFLAAKAAKAAAATPKKPKAAAAAAAAAAPAAPIKAAKGGAGAPSEEDEEAAFSSSSTLALFSAPPKPPAPTPGSLPRLPSLTPETAAAAATASDEMVAVAVARAEKQLAKASAAVPRVVKKVVKKGGGGAAAAAATLLAEPPAVAIAMPVRSLGGTAVSAKTAAKIVATATAAAAPHRSSNEKGAAIFARSDPEPWTWNGRALLKNIRNEVWATDGEGERVWVGVYDPEADTMDEMVDEPTA